MNRSPYMPRAVYFNSMTNITILTVVILAPHVVTRTIPGHLSNGHTKMSSPCVFYREHRLPLTTVEPDIERVGLGTMDGG